MPIKHWSISPYGVQKLLAYLSAIAGKVPVWEDSKEFPLRRPFALWKSEGEEAKTAIAVTHFSTAGSTATALADSLYHACSSHPVAAVYGDNCLRPVM